MLAVPAKVKDDAPARQTGRKVSISAVLDNPNLPSPPALVLQIVEKASQPGCDPAEVVALLNKDSGLCCQVLKTVNSGLFGLSKPVGSLKQAVLMLGVRPLRSLVLSLALPAIRIPDRDDLVLKYWQESVAGAVIARELAVLLKRKDPDDDLIAGLLRDLGILVLREAFADEYSPLWRQNAKAWGGRQCDLERETFGVDHAEISAAILESWNLPEEIHQPIRHHHDPAAFTDGPESLQQRAWLLFFANKVATMSGHSTSTVTDLLKIAKERFAIDQAALLKFLNSVTPNIQEFAALLRVDIGQCPNYSGIMAAGCQELVRLSMAPAIEAAQSTAANQKTQAYRLPELAPHQAPSGNLPEFTLECLEKLPAGGVQLNDYELREILGRGAMGVVFKGYDPSLDRFVAIKMLTPERLVLAEAREWFKREARAAAAIQHEHIVTIYAVSDMHGLPYLVMEYLSGVSLQDRVDKEGALPLADVIRFGRQIASGLHAAHSRRVIHRDVKPANILLGHEPGTVKVSDFGLARVVDDAQRSQDGMWVGTPQYMAPEQFAAGGVDNRADLFALGGLLYTLCAGTPPFSGDTLQMLVSQIRNTPATPLRSVRPETPHWLADVIDKLHAKPVADRFQSAQEVMQAFDRQA